MTRLEPDQVPPEKLLDFCSRSLYTLDGLWFIALEEIKGFETALEIDAEVWTRLTRVQAKRVKEFFAIDEDNPLQTVMSIMELDPLLRVFRPKVVELNDRRAVFRFLDCPPQKARLRDGRPPMPCRQLSMVIYQAYADAVDPAIKLKYVHCPPDPHPPEYWCEWQFEI